MQTITIIISNIGIIITHSFIRTTPNGETASRRSSLPCTPARTHSLRTVWVRATHEPNRRVCCWVMRQHMWELVGLGTGFLARPTPDPRTTQEWRFSHVPPLPQRLTNICVCRLPCSATFPTSVSHPNKLVNPHKRVLQPQLVAATPQRSSNSSSSWVQHGAQHEVDACGHTQGCSEADEDCRNHWCHQRPCAEPASPQHSRYTGCCCCRACPCVCGHTGGAAAT